MTEQTTPMYLVTIKYHPVGLRLGESFREITFPIKGSADALEAYTAGVQLFEQEALRGIVGSEVRRVEP